MNTQSNLEQQELQNVLTPQSIDAEMIISAELLDLADGPTPTMPRSRGQVTRDFDTVMDGIFIDTESYAVGGFMLVDPGCRVYGPEEFYVTAEPRNLEPIEVVVFYKNGQLPSLHVYDWWTSHQTGNGWKFVRWIDDSFMREFGIPINLPGGKRAQGFNFFTGYLPKIGCNSVAIKRNTGEWVRIPINNQAAGMPKPAGNNASGWAVLEFKRMPGNAYRYPDIPNGIGIGINSILDGAGNVIPLSSLKLRHEKESKQYRTLFESPTEFGEVNP